MTALCRAAEEYIALRHRLGFSSRHSSRDLAPLREIRGPAASAGGDDCARPVVGSRMTGVLPATAARSPQRRALVRGLVETAGASHRGAAQAPHAGATSAARPFLHSTEQIAKLLVAARQLDSKSGVRGLTYSTLFGLIAVAGLRISEAVKLDREDVDLVEGVLTIRATKFGKTRLVPLHPSTTSALAEYAAQRDAAAPRSGHPRSSSPSGAGALPTGAPDITLPTYRSRSAIRPSQRGFTGRGRYRTDVARGSTICATASPPRPCSRGIATAPMSSGSCQSSRRTSATSRWSIPTGTSRRYRSCCSSPARAWSAIGMPRFGDDDHHLPDAAADLLHRQARPTVCAPVPIRSPHTATRSGCSFATPSSATGTADEAADRKPRRGLHRQFLDHLETKRGNSVRTRNMRLAAIRSFFRYVAICEPAYALHCERILSMPDKRHEHRPVAFLSRAEVEALLDAPSKTTWAGRRDRVLLLVAVQTGLRVSELIELRRQDVSTGPGATCVAKGKAARSGAHLFGATPPPLSQPG